MIENAGETNIKKEKELDDVSFFSLDLTTVERELLVWRLGFERGMSMCVCETKKVTNPLKFQ